MWCSSVFVCIIIIIIIKTLTIVIIIIYDCKKNDNNHSKLIKESVEFYQFFVWAKNFCNMQMFSSGLIGFLPISIEFQNYLFLFLFFIFKIYFIFQFMMMMIQSNQRNKKIVIWFYNRSDCPNILVVIFVE